VSGGTARVVSYAVYQGALPHRQNVEGCEPLTSRASAVPAPAVVPDSVISQAADVGVDEELERVEL
jgi:hypothetical protein